MRSFIRENNVHKNWLRIARDREKLKLLIETHHRYKNQQ